MGNRRKHDEITEANIEEMCLLAEDIMHQLYMNFADYDEEGNDILMKYYREGIDYETEIKAFVREEREAIYETSNHRLLYDLFRRGDDLGKVRYYTIEDIRPWIEPIIPKALQLFRKGTNFSGETNFTVAKTVSDDYLIAIFAREVRNMMMIFSGQNMQKTDTPHYLLLLEGSSCHDFDEWMGIYFDDNKLKEAYDLLVAELEEIRKSDRNYRMLEIAIWEFCPRREYQDGSFTSLECISAKQDIRHVKLDELHCFKERFV